MDKVLAAIGSLGGAPEDVVRTRVYLRRADDWEVVSRVHARVFSGTRPANTLLGGVHLIGPYLVEVEAEAELSGNGD
jgi:enamine deaminase RidA (YjgF/YER057c/UK114 family)